VAVEVALPIKVTAPVLAVLVVLAEVVMETLAVILFHQGLQIRAAGAVGIITALVVLAVLA
jgi:hypothetical protein